MKACVHQTLHLPIIPYDDFCINYRLFDKTVLVFSSYHEIVLYFTLEPFSEAGCVSASGGVQLYLDNFLLKSYRETLHYSMQHWRSRPGLPEFCELFHRDFNRTSVGMHFGVAVGTAYLASDRELLNWHLHSIMP